MVPYGNVMEKVEGHLVQSYYQINQLFASLQELSKHRRKISI